MLLATSLSGRYITAVSEGGDSMWRFESFGAHLGAGSARPVAAILLAGSLMGFALGQEAGHSHALRQHSTSRPPVSAVAPRPTATPTATTAPTVPHVVTTIPVNPVSSNSPPAAQPGGSGDHEGDGGHGGDGDGGKHKGG